MSHGENSSILIIGAGIAGLTAARTLLQHGFKNITIMEANEKTGGRVRTSRFGSLNIKIEIGAQRLHSLTNNPLCHELVQMNLVEKNLFKKKHNFYSNEMVDLIYFFDNQQLNVNQEFYRQQMKKCNDFLQNFYQKPLDFVNKGAAAAEDEEADDDSLGIALNKALINWLNNSIDLKDHKEMKKVQKLCLHQKHFHEGTNQLNNVSLSSSLWYENEGGEIFSPMQDGMSSMIDAWTRQISSKHILLQHVVKKLDYSNNNNEVLVTFQKLNNMNDKQYFQSKFHHVIVTSSLTFLQCNHEQLFYPKIPASLTNAWSKLSLGIIEKLFIEFNQPLAEEKYKVYGIMQNNDFILPRNHPDWFLQGIVLLFTLHQSGRYVYAPLVGEFAQELVRIPNDELKSKIEKHFIKVTGNSSLKVLHLAKSSWCEDPHIMGSYSYIRPNTHPSIFYDLSQSICNRENKIPLILFAGEYMHPIWFSLMQGAYDTGKQAALKLIQLDKLRPRL